MNTSYIRTLQRKNLDHTNLFKIYSTLFSLILIESKRTNTFLTTIKSPRVTSTMSSKPPRHPRSSPSPDITSNRKRLPSCEIPRSYSGQFGRGGDANDGDLLPFELSRNRNTEWITHGGNGLLFTYIVVLGIFEFVSMSYLPFTLSWTATNVMHGFLTFVYLHWIKGSPNFYDQNEMSGMTVWEQLDGAEPAYTPKKRVAMVIPSVLCYLACHFVDYDLTYTAYNVACWLVLCIIPKMPFMHGVRLLGINRTAGIDDESSKASSKVKRK